MNRKSFDVSFVLLFLMAKSTGWLRTSDFESSCLEHPLPVDPPVVFRDDWDNGEPRLDGEVEATFLEGQEVRYFTAVAGPFGKHPQRYSELSHNFSGGFE